MKRKEMDEKKRKQQEEEENMRIRAERRLVEEMETIDQIDGQFAFLAESFLYSKTNRTVALDSMQLSKIHLRLLFRLLSKNNSIQAISVNRLELEDEDIEILFSALETNSTLEHIDLESNLLTSESLKYIGKCLKVNSSIRFVSLEGNNLSIGEDDLSFVNFEEDLRENNTLIYLSLSDTLISDEVMPNLISIADNNPNLIMIDLTDNNLNHSLQCELQNILKNNREEYELQRAFEFAERQGIQREYLAGSHLNEERQSKEEEINRIIKELEIRFEQISSHRFA